MSDIWLVTAYCLGAACGALDHGVTTGGTVAAVGRTVACPPELPFGTVVRIRPLGLRVCEDRGGAITGKHLDVFMQDRETALAWGTRRHRVWIVGRLDWRRSVKDESRIYPSQAARAKALGLRLNGDAEGALVGYEPEPPLPDNKPEPDVELTNHGTIVLFSPRTLSAERWLRAHTDGTWWGAGVGSLVVEPRYALDLIAGLEGAGFTVKER